MTDFRTVLLALRPYISDVYSLSAAADAIVAIVPAPVEQVKLEIPHDALVAMALGSPEVMGYLVNSQKIQGIKALRTLAGYQVAGLRATKNAVEDQRVTAEVSLMQLREKLTGDPWRGTSSYDEQPF